MRIHLNDPRAWLEIDFNLDDVGNADLPGNAREAGISRTERGLRRNATSLETDEMRLIQEDEAWLQREAVRIFAWNERDPAFTRNRMEGRKCCGATRIFVLSGNHEGSIARLDNAISQNKMGPRQIHAIATIWRQVRSAILH